MYNELAGNSQSLDTEAARVVEQRFFIKWYRRHGRDFPWRQDRLDPYKSLVTEMLLRQTRAEGVAKLWDKFFERYPDVESLALAKRGRLREFIAILGFGSQRAEALIHAAKFLVEHHGGKVPNKLECLLAVPHIGHYAARAVLCFAFGRPVEIVDVNVLRFFARYFGITVKPDIRRSPAAWELAARLLPTGSKRAQQHNYGMLDFTAQVCKAGTPRCGICPLASSCVWQLTQVEKMDKQET